jgi:hypothetical protein
MKTRRRRRMGLERERKRKMMKPFREIPALFYFILFYFSCLIPAVGRFLFNPSRWEI